MTIKTNNPNDVSTLKGVKGGYMFMAPVGTKLPDKPLFTVDELKAVSEDYANAGYVSSDGWSESVDIDTSDSVNDERGDTVVSSEATKYTEKITCTLISTNKDSMTLQYGRQNVTDANGVLKVDHNWSNAGDHWSVVLLLLAKNNRPWTKVIKDCNVTSLGEFKLDKDDAAGREVELTYQNDETGSGCVDYIKSTDTTGSSTPGK